MLRRTGSLPSLPMNAFDGPVQGQFRAWGARRVRALHPFPFADPALARFYGVDRAYVIDLPAGTDTPRMVQALRGIPGAFDAVSLDGVGSLAEFFPNDPEFVRQYGLHNEGQIGGTLDADVDAPAAWSIHTGNAGTVTIAFVDSGIDEHPDLLGRLIAGQNVNDPTNPTETTDPVGHGTHVAGVAGATGHNGFGVAGMSWGASLMPVRYTNSRGTGTSSQVAAGILWAADNGADVINLSVQFYNLDAATEATFESAVNYAHDRGILLIAAAGNEDLFFGRPPGPVAAPARFANCMAVTATTSSDAFASFSNFGPEVDICAPGAEIYSTDDALSFRFRSGTSAAAPLVSGLAALMLSFAPELTNDQVRDLLVATVEDLGPPGHDTQFGYGRINAHQALRALLSPVFLLGSDPPDGAIDARQPFDPDGSNVQGWQQIDLFLAAPPSVALMPEDFTVNQVSRAAAQGTADASGASLADAPVDGAVSSDSTVEGGPLSGPAIEDVIALDETTVRVVLSEPIPPGTWTQITLTRGGVAQSVCLGYLPGDANGDRTANPALDLTALITCLEVGGCPDWQTDINRSGDSGTPDVARLIDLFNGPAAYSSWTGAHLDPSPCE